MPEGRGRCRTAGRATEAYDRGEAGGAAGVQEQGTAGGAEVGAKDAGEGQVAGQHVRRWCQQGRGGEV